MCWLTLAQRTNNRLCGKHFLACLKIKYSSEDLKGPTAVKQCRVWWSRQLTVNTPVRRKGGTINRSSQEVSEYRNPQAYLPPSISRAAIALAVE